MRVVIKTDLADRIRSTIKYHRATGNEVIFIELTQEEVCNLRDSGYIEVRENARFDGYPIRIV